MSSPSPVKVGLIGFGVSANIFNLPYMLPCKDLELYAVLQRHKPNEAGLAWGHVTERYPQARWYGDLNEFLADPQVELVVITTGHRSHFPLAYAALTAGKHVLVEKAFTARSCDADTLITLAKSKNLVLTCYQNRRWDGDFQTVQNLLSMNAFGQLTDVVIQFDLDAPPWIEGWTGVTYEEGSGDGMLFAMGSHTIDQALQILGRPEKVTAWLRSFRTGKQGKQIQSEIDDTFMVVLEYGKDKGGVLCTVKTSVVDFVDAPQRLVVKGREGSYIKRGGCVQERHSMQGMKSEDKGFGIDDEALWGELVTLKEVKGASQSWDEKRGRWVGRMPTEKAYWRGLYENVAKAVRGQQELKIKPEESRDVIRIIELARESAMTGRTVEWS